MRQSLHQDEIEFVSGLALRVVGVLFRDGVPWLYVCEDENAEYPVPYCIEFFERERLTIPPEWELTWTGQRSQLVPRWWAEVPHFLERLVDGEPAAVARFKARNG